jgi:hypothetical protein
MVSVGRMPERMLVLHAELCADYIGSLDQNKQDQNKTYGPRVALRCLRGSHGTIRSTREGN